MKMIVIRKKTDSIEDTSNNKYIQIYSQALEDNAHLLAFYDLFGPNTSKSVYDEEEKISFIEKRIRNSALRLKWMNSHSPITQWNGFSNRKWN